MPQSHSQVWLHTVFSTKNRQNYFADPEFREQMFRMIAHHVKEMGCVVAIVGGHVDHVHLLTSLSRTLKICKFVEVVKTETSKWAKAAEGGHREFAWQAGYGVFSVSASSLVDVKRYVESQEQHHAQRSYQDEFRLLCEKHGIEIDERYVWD